jgi:hypothetical protein
MIALERVWRWRKYANRSWVEVAEPGGRCDWVLPGSPYVQLGMVRPELKVTA